MNINHLFCMSGCGYLKEILQIDGKEIAIIKAINQYDMSTLNKDDVWIDCEVTNTVQLARLNQLLVSVRAGKEVIIIFKAEYSAFVNAHACLPPGDPNHIITLQSKLRLLEDCYINGRLAENNRHKLRVVV